MSRMIPKRFRAKPSGPIPEHCGNDMQASRKSHTTAKAWNAGKPLPGVLCLTSQKKVQRSGQEAAAPAMEKQKGGGTCIRTPRVTGPKGDVTLVKGPNFPVWFMMA